MVAVVKNETDYTINTELKSITPYQVYLLQIQGDFDTIRQKTLGYDYIPPHLGGMISQREALNQQIVLQVSNFKVK